MNQQDEPADDLLDRAETLIELRRFDAALTVLARAASLDAQHPRTHGLIARSLLGLARPAEALTAADRAAALAPEWAWPHRLRSLALDRLGRPVQALAAAKEAVRLAPSDPHSLALQAEAFLVLKDIGSAERSARAAVRMAPQSAVAHGTLGLWALRAKNYGEGEAACHRALTIDPRNAAALNNLAVIYLMQGRMLKALGTFNGAVRLDPTDDKPRGGIRLIAYLGVGLSILLAVVAGSRFGAGAGAVVLLATFAAATGSLFLAPALSRRRSTPATVIARDVLLLGGVRRPRNLTPEGVLFNRIRLGLGLVLGWGGLSVLADPTGKRNAGVFLTMMGGALALAAGRRLLLSHRSQRRVRKA